METAECQSLADSAGAWEAIMEEGQLLIMSAI